MLGMSVVTGAQLRELLDHQPPPVVLDVRWSLKDGALRADYLRGHVEGAVFVDFDAQLCGPPGDRGRHPLPDVESLQETLRACGVDSDRAVVVYDGGDNLAAARTWWTLRWAGHPDVRVLDGGIVEAERAGLAASRVVPAPARGDFTVDPGQLPVLDSAQAARLAAEGTLVDVRASARYCGEVEPIDPVAGHIPGAVNLPAEDSMNPRTAGFVDAATLTRQFHQYREEPVGVYCGSGVTAARTALAMTVAGHPTPAVYIGSWSGWVVDPARPVATGDR